MALLKSIDISIGSAMPDFTLLDTAGVSLNGHSLMGSKGLLVAFTCNHCPYAIAIWPRLIQLAQEIKAWGIETVAINPNIHPDYPEDAPDKMKEKIREWSISFPYLIDETQSVAKAFDAQCTPDLYLYDTQNKLFYHGRLDDNWQDEKQVAHRELREAALSLSKDEQSPPNQHPSMGCSIKWK